MARLEPLTSNRSAERARKAGERRALREQGRAGAHVVIATRNPDRLEEARIGLEHIRRAPTQVIRAVTMDVDDENSVAEGVEVPASALGGLDVLVANQGYAETGYFEDVPARVFEAIMRTHYFGHVDERYCVGWVILLPLLVESLPCWKSRSFSVAGQAWAGYVKRVVA